MPLDGTELWLADFADGDGAPRVTYARKLAGGTDVSIYQPEFSPDGRTLAYVSDETGWGQIYLHDLADGSVRRLTEGEAEHGQPAWTQGKRSFAFVEGGRRLAAVRSDRGFDRLILIDTASGAVSEAASGMAEYSYIDQVTASPAGDHVAAVASSAVRPPRVVSMDVTAGTVRVWARASGETVPPAALSQPEPFSWTSFDGEEAHGLFYPPASERFTSPGLPPLIVLVHGGPTSQSRASWAANAQFFATRGYAVLLVNYRGSTGYGRDYMRKLRGSWGIYDVEDCVSGARALGTAGRVDPVKRVIMGGSAGGFTVLQTLVMHPGVFTAGICLFGVSNQFTLAADTHKFEARYLDSILGPLPEAAALYRDRSPIFHAERIADPIAVFQGEIDQVVPKAQSDEIVASLRARGVPHEYHVYPGEGHGWRKAETIEAFYNAVDRFLRQYVVFA
jgi:dipeptidyl aminopeptidase/acylaminoacyl peptidase